MVVQKLSTTDAFVVVDFPDAPASGIVRRARKILQASASDVARSATYTFGVFGVERSGASAGINAEGDAVSAAVEAFVAELTPRVAAGDLHLTAGKGVDASALGAFGAISPLGSIAGSDEVLVAGIVAAAEWVAGGSLSGCTAAIEGAHLAPAGLRDRLTDAGVAVVDVWGVDEKPWLVWGAEVDLIFAGSKPGVLTHQGAGMVSARALVPWGPIPVTTKAFAQLRRDGRVELVPDFLSTAGYLLAGVTDAALDTVEADVASRIADALEVCASHDDGLFLGACHRAETFFETWQGSRPFGRPLAG